MNTALKVCSATSSYRARIEWLQVQRPAFHSWGRRDGERDMNIKHLLTAAAATFVLTVSSVASAADANRNNSRVVVGQNAHHTTITERFRGHPGNVVVRERFRGHPNNVVVRERFRGRPLITRTRVVEVLRGRHIRFVGT